jgi:hypothetical protein
LAKNIVISGDTLTGKTMVAIAIAGKLRTMGKKVGYFKPAGTKSYHHSTPEVDVDEDAAVMKELLKMDEPLAAICPIVRAKTSYDELLKVGADKLKERVLSSHAKISEGKDYVLVEGTKAPWHLLHVSLSTPQIAAELDASVFCLVNFPDITAIDDALMQSELFSNAGVEDIGIVLTQAPPMLRKAISESIGPYLVSEGMKYCGTIYHNRELFSPTIREIHRALDGEMVLGESKMDVPIDQFMVGSMAPENALKWFRRAKDMAVITSGDRADICQAALETDTNLLVLTGGLGPDIGTLTRARELDVPIMTTAHDTYRTSQIVDDLIGTVSADNPEKLLTVERTVGDALDFSCMGL